MRKSCLNCVSCKVIRETVYGEERLFVDLNCKRFANTCVSEIECMTPERRVVCSDYEVRNELGWDYDLEVSSAPVSTCPFLENVDCHGGVSVFKSDRGCYRCHALKEQCYKDIGGDEVANNFKKDFPLHWEEAIKSLIESELCVYLGGC